MSRSVERSYELYTRAQRLIPGGTQLLSRRPSKFASGVSPVYAQRAKGARFWDVDGNEYIDWASGIASVILGYADPVVDEAVCAQIARGLTTSVNHELEIELADELVASIPCAEMVRYAKSGGEACAVAVRIARGVTGRDRVLFCGYHGWHDWYVAANLGEEAALSTHLFPGIEPIGVPKCLEGTALPFPYGDLQALSDRLEAHRGAIAAIIMEPVRSEPPPQGYLEAVRALATAHDVVLIFDEVSCGFRISHGGAQERYGVTPDMAVFAKAISNGYPMAAVVGKRAVMEPAGRMFISSTYFSDAIGLTAALTTLRELKRRNVSAQLNAFGARLQASLNEVAEESELAVRCTGLPVHPALQFATDDPLVRKKLTTLYIQEMAKRGCHGYASFYLNAAQGEAELEQTLDAARQVFPTLRDGWANGTLDDLLECDLSEDAFRRLVR